MQQEMFRFDKERTIGERFEKWLSDPAGQSVYREFVAIAKQLRAAGHEHYGAKSILEVLRFHRSVRGPASDNFAINNVFGSRMARLAMQENEDLQGLFELRELKSE